MSSPSSRTSPASDTLSVMHLPASPSWPASRCLTAR